MHSRFSHPDNFSGLVLRHYKFLVDEFDFKIIHENNWTYIFESTSVRVMVMMENTIDLVVEIEPIGESARFLLRQNILPFKLSVISICMCLDETLNYKIEKISEKKLIIDTPKEIEKRALLLKQYCPHILRGDFTDWKHIIDCLSRRSKEFLNVFRV